MCSHDVSPFLLSYPRSLTTRSPRLCLLPISPPSSFNCLVLSFLGLQTAPQREPPVPPRGQQSYQKGAREAEEPTVGEWAAGKVGHHHQGDRGSSPRKMSPGQLLCLPKTFIPSLNSRPFLRTTLVSSGISVTVSFNRETTVLVALGSSDWGATRTFFVTVWI